MKRREPIDVFTEIILLLIFAVAIYLKVTNVIQISWLWLLSPIWFCLALGGILAVIMMIILIITIILSNKEKKDERN